MTLVPQAAPRAVLVTGASGFVGRHLIRHLLAVADAAAEGGADTLHIVAATHQRSDEAEPPTAAALAGWNPAVADPRVTLVSLDVRDAGALAATMTGFRPAQVYHLAARASGADAERDRVMEINVLGTRNVLDAAGNLSPAPRVLLASTGYVYGDTDPTRPAREEDPLAPTHRYGAYTDSKIEMENVARSYDRLALVARAFGHTGPGQTPTFAIPSFARQLARIEAGLEQPELSVGNLSAQRDMLDVRDVVQAYRLLMTYGEPGTVANVSLGQPRSMREILEILVSHCTVPITVRVDPNRLRPADIGCSCGDPSLLHRLAAWRATYRLEETLEATLNYWRERMKAEL